MGAAAQGWGCAAFGMRTWQRRSGSRAGCHTGNYCITACLALALRGSLSDAPAQAALDVLCVGIRPLRAANRVKEGKWMQLCGSDVLLPRKRKVARVQSCGLNCRWLPCLPGVRQARLKRHRIIAGCLGPLPPLNEFFSRKMAKCTTVVIAFPLHCYDRGSSMRHCLDLP